MLSCDSAAAAGAAATMVTGASSTGACSATGSAGEVAGGAATAIVRATVGSGPAREPGTGMRGSACVSPEVVTASLSADGILAVTTEDGHHDAHARLPACGAGLLGTPATQAAGGRARAARDRRDDRAARRPRRRQQPAL